MNSPVAAEAEALFQRALSLYQRSRFTDAKILCDAVMDLMPRNFKALHLLGLIAVQSKDAARAVELFEEAILCNPRNEIAHNNLGNALAAVGRLEASLASYNKAIAINRRYADAFYNRGNALAAQERYGAAIESYNKAIALKNDFVEAYFNRGNALVAVESRDLALKSYGRAISLRPGYAEAYLNRGSVLQELKEWSAAFACYNQAIALKPGCAEAHANRGTVLIELNEPSEALASYDCAIAARPEYAEAYLGRGNAHRGLNQIDTAIADYDRAIAFKSDYADALYNRSLAYLLSGDFEKGWTGHEWRWRSRGAASAHEMRSFKQPLWLGEEKLAGKVILIYGEQGLGDRIQFSRYAKLVAELDATVILEAPRPLVKILSSLDGVSQIIEKGTALPEFDYQCPLFTLPLAFKTTIATIPMTDRYLRSDECSLERWHARLRGTARPRVGLAWSGAKGHLNDRNRSLALADVMRSLPASFQFISLQKEVRDSDMSTLRSSQSILDVSAELNDFSDTAALCELMDLVISVDTSIAHLSGALGKKTWILLPFAPDWRWLLGRNDCPWYRAVKLYRQQTHGDWSGVLARVKADLKSEFPGSPSPT